MAEKKVHKKEKPNKVEPTPQEKKAVDMRKSGLSLREISENLNIPRKEVEVLVAGVTPAGRGPVSKEEAGKQYDKDQENKSEVKEQNAKDRADGKERAAKKEAKKGK